MSRRGRGLGAIALALAAPACALAGSTTALEPGAGLAGARLAVDPAGVTAALYPARGDIRVQIADSSVPSEHVPLPAGAVVEGFAMAAGGRPAVLVRVGRGCSSLLLAIRTGPNRWDSAPVTGPPAHAATLAVDAAGGLSALAAGCDGVLSVRFRDLSGEWSSETVGAGAAPDARLALAVGAGGPAVAAWGGRRAGIAVRDSVGGWRSVGLPGGELRARDTISSVAVALDPLGRPVALVSRGPRRPLDPRADALGDVERRAGRLVGVSWAPVGDGPGEPLTLAGAGQSFALARRGGMVALESPAGVARVALDPLTLAVGAGGTLAYLPRGRPSVLGIGAPPRLALSGPAAVPWGSRLSLEARLTDGDAPLVGVRLQMRGAAGVTGPDGRARLETEVTESGAIDVAAVSPGRLAPAFGSASVRVLPRPARLSGRLTRRGGRVVVRGRVSGGARLPGGLGRVWLVNRASGRSGFLPGRALASTAARGSFTLTARRQRGARYALFFQGRTRPLTPRG